MTNRKNEIAELYGELETLTLREAALMTMLKMVQKKAEQVQAEIYDLGIYYDWEDTKQSMMGREI